MTLRPSHLAAQVASLRRRLPDADAIALHSSSPWGGPDELAVGDLQFLVVNCPSELSIRQALVDSAARNLPVVCVTPLLEQDLGADLRARLAKRRVFAVDAWASVKDVFSATHLDPVLLKKKWLAETLLEHYPNPDYGAAPNGTLTAETVWRHVLKNLLGLDASSPDLRDLLTWTLNRQGIARYGDLTEEQQQDIAERIRRSAGAAARYVLACVKNGSPDKVLPLCLACEVVYGARDPLPGELQAAAARLEKYTGGIAIDPESGRKLANAGVLLCEGMATNGGWKTVDRLVTVLDDILQDVGALTLSHLSCLSSVGFEKQLAGFAAAALAVLSEEAEPETCWPHVVRIRGHYQGRSAPDRVARAEMAYRTLRWIRRVPSAGTAPASLGDAMQRYVHSDSYVDWALTVLSGTEGNEKLAAAYAETVRRAEAVRSSFDVAFAELLRQWTGAAGAGGHPLGIEEVLDRVVTPLAKCGPALLVVLDGMSCSVFDELMADILQRGHWYELSPAGPSRATALATVPSTTEVSRRSLLCGRLVRDADLEEDAGFASHPGLAATSSAPPVLYRKADLVEAGGTRLAAKVRSSIQSSRQRVVGVVINAVDDYLLKGDQLRVSWRLASISVLESLLQAAQGAGRTVVLTSDHGHVMERGTKYVADDSGGERHRKDDGSPEDGELQIRGKRVLAFDSKLIAPWNSSLRYGPKRNGYHGGISPREMVVPIAVLNTTPDGPKGWGLVASAVPPWWHLEGGPAVPTAETGADDSASLGSLSDLPLFDAAEAGGGADWMGRLLRSPVFSHNRELCGRSALSNARIVRLLSVLEEHGFTVMQQRLATDMAVPPFRLPGIVRVAQRMLNVDGYSVLSYDQGSGTITLDLALLQKQFELDE